jgi:hypothetical protein
MRREHLAIIAGFVLMAILDVVGVNVGGRGGRLDG